MKDLVDITFDKIIKKGFDVNASPFNEKVVVMASTAQGIIDNGGFDYFFENEFEGSPDYEEFIKVFNAIGALESAEAIKDAIEINKHSGINKFESLDTIVIERSKDTYQKLSDYIESNSV